MRVAIQQVPSGEFIHPDLPVSAWSVGDTLSGPQSLNITFPARYDMPDIKKGHAAAWAEFGGGVYGGIIDTVKREGSSVTAECVGFTSMLRGQPYTGEGKVWSKVDPLEVVRFIWTHWQSYPTGNLGVVLDNTSSPIRIGEEQYVPIDTSLSEFDTTFSDGPIRLNWYDTHDLGGVIDEYVQQGYFDYHEENAWTDAGVAHRLRLHYPRKGRRQHDLRFIYGENIYAPPSLDIAEEGYASEVMFLGAGEGRAKVRATVTAERRGIRNVAVVVDDRIKRQTDATARARRELAARNGEYEITSLAVIDHPSARLGSWGVGDEIRVQGTWGGQNVDQWVRVLSWTVDSGSRDIAQVEVRRVE